MRGCAGTGLHGLRRYLFLCVLPTVRATLEGCTATGWYVVPQPRWLRVMHPLTGKPVRILCFYYAHAHLDPPHVRQSHQVKRHIFDANTAAPRGWSPRCTGSIPKGLLVLIDTGFFTMLRVPHPTPLSHKSTTGWGSSVIHIMYVSVFLK